MDLDGSASFYTVDLNYSFNENWGATLGLVSLDGESGLIFQRDTAGND